MNKGIHRFGISEKLIRSTTGQNPTPASQAPNKSLLIFLAQLPRVKLPACIRLVAKNMQVKEGPKNICPMAAFCRVENSDVPTKGGVSRSDPRVMMCKWNGAHITEPKTYLERGGKYSRTKSEQLVRNTIVLPKMHPQFAFYPTFCCCPSPFQCIELAGPTQQKQTKLSCFWSQSDFFPGLWNNDGLLP